MTLTERLRATVRVLADGTVASGIKVPHRGANIKGHSRIVAATPRRAKAEHFRSHAGVPSDVTLPDGRRTDILAVTLPHDCANHLVGAGL
jgi:hypothetical protein